MRLPVLLTGEDEKCFGLEWWSVRLRRSQEQSFQTPGACYHVPRYCRSMLQEPIPATRRALERSGRRLDEIDLYEVNEAFAPVPLAWLGELDADPNKLNVNGGAIALGHPLGASGTKLMATLVHGLRARGKRFGLQTMCEGGGIANVTIVEAL